MVENAVPAGEEGAPGAPRVVEVRLLGDLTLATLRDALGPVRAQLDATTDPVALVVDASGMTGYDADSRTEFIRWNAEHRLRIHRVAIVTQRIAWRMVISGMGLAARRELRPFADLKAAREWAGRED